MQLRAFTEYAIRILRHLDVHGPERRSALEIAKELGIPYSNFAQVAVKLRQAGLLTSVQGRTGGYQLGRPAREISVYDVFRCIEGDLQISRYLLKEAQSDSDKPGDQKTQAFLQNLQNKMIAELSDKSIADLGQDDSVPNDRDESENL